MKDNIQTDIEQRNFNKSVLNDLNRIASALERLADQWEECDCQNDNKKEVQN